MNLVMAAFRRLFSDDIIPFVFSLKRIDFDGRIVVFYSETSKQTHDLLCEYNVEAVNFDNIAERFNMQVHGLRYFLYNNYLQSHPEITNVLISDIRDVVFQQDPFADPFPASFCSCMEADRLIGECPINSGWIRAKFGHEVLNQIAHLPVVCSGISYGTRQGMLTYLQGMRELLLPPVPLAGFDQGVHNVLLHRNGLPGSMCIPNGEDRVLTMGGMKDEVFDVDDLGSLSYRGRTYPVLHQYDRYPDLPQRLAVVQQCPKTGERRLS